MAVSINRGSLNRDLYDLYRAPPNWLGVDIGQV